MQNLTLSSRIKETSKSRGISVKFLLESCSMNRNTIYDLEKKEAFPSCDKLSKIADFLHCSVDFLLGRISANEQELLQNYRKISPVAKKQIHMIIDNEINAVGAAPVPSGDLLAELLEIEKNTAQIAAYGGGTTTVSGGDIDLDEIE